MSVSANVTAEVTLADTDAGPVARVGAIHPGDRAAYPQAVAQPAAVLLQEQTDVLSRPWTRRKLLARALTQTGLGAERRTLAGHSGAVLEPPPEPFAVDHLDVGDGHVLYIEQVGNPDGTPVVYLHGGPGSGCTPGARRSFDLERHRAVLFDQRAAGRSTPHASEDGVDWASMDMDHHVGDIELVREHLGIDRWIVFGVSWGSVLGATYAERHPDRVTAVVLGAVSTGTAADIDWLTVHAGRFFPAEWHQFRDHVPAELRGMRLVDAYNTLLMDPDPSGPRRRRSGVVPLGGRPRGDDAGCLTEPALRRRRVPARLRSAGHVLLAQQLVARSGRDRRQRRPAGRDSRAG